MSSATSYRCKPAAPSDSDSSASDEEDQPWKRQKRAAALKREVPMVVSDAGVSSRNPGSESKRFRRKRNNVWGEVVQKQEEDQVARDIIHFDMYASKERDVESYSFTAKPQLLGVPVGFEGPAGSRDRKLPEALGGSNDDAWLVGGGGGGAVHVAVKGGLGSKDDDVTSAEGGGGGHPGCRREITTYESDVKYTKIEPDMHKKEVAGKIAYSLQEPKRDMVKTAVDELGVEKAIAMWKETCDIAQNGGMMVNNGTRKRTPGGIFFQLLKRDSEIPKEAKDAIFAASQSQSKKDGKSRRQRLRKKKSTNQTDTGQDDGRYDEEDGGRNAAERWTNEGVDNDVSGEEEEDHVEGETEMETHATPLIERADRVIDDVRYEAHIRGGIDCESSVAVKSAPRVAVDEMEDGEISD